MSDAAAGARGGGGGGDESLAHSHAAAHSPQASRGGRERRGGGGGVSASDEERFRGLARRHAAAYARFRHSAVLRALSTRRAFEADLGKLDHEALELAMLFLTALGGELRGVRLFDTRGARNGPRLRGMPTSAEILAAVGRALPKALATATQLEELDLSGLRGAPLLFVSVARAMRGCRALQRVRVRNCSVGDAALDDLAAALGELTVSEVQLRACELGPKSGLALRRLVQRHGIRRDSAQWASGLRSEAHARAQGPGLLFLDVSCNTLGGEALAQICDALAQDAWLAAVDLRLTAGADGDAAIASVAAALADNRTLQHVLIDPPGAPGTFSPALLAKLLQRVERRAAALPTPPMPLSELPFEAPTPSDLAALAGKRRLSRSESQTLTSFLREAAAAAAGADEEETEASDAPLPAGDARGGNNATLVERLLRELRAHTERERRLARENAELRQRLAAAESARGEAKGAKGEPLQRAEAAELERLLTYMEDCFRRLHLYLDGVERERAGAQRQEPPQPPPPQQQQQQQIPPGGLAELIVAATRSPFQWSAAPVAPLHGSED
jgi:hypothetical protein